MKLKYVPLYILGICIVMFILQYIIPGFTESFLLFSDDIFIRPWIIITHMFLHGSGSHILYNMFALVMFGLILESIIGSKKFAIVYFTSGIIAALGSVFFYSATLGASGAIFGILGALAILRPKMTVFIGYIPMPMIIAAGVWVAIDLFGILFPTNVANVAHILGLLTGVAFGLYYRKRYGEYLSGVSGSIRVNEREIEKWERRWMHHRNEKRISFLQYLQSF